MINKSGSLKKPKTITSQSISWNKLFTGKEVIQKQKAKEEQLAEFARAVEFESRNKKARI